MTPRVRPLVSLLCVLTLVGGLLVPVAWPQVTSTLIQRTRATDGTREISTLFDADSGAGVQWLEGVVMRMSASGGSVEVFRAEDSGHTSGDPGLMVFCVRNDAATVLAGTTLDYIPCTTNASGQILVALPAGAAATQVQGTADDGAAEVGNPVQIGGVDAGGLMRAVLVGTDRRFDVNLGQIAGTTAATNAGVLGAGVLRVTVATDDEINDDLDAIRIALEIMDDWDETNRAAVNLIAGQVAVAGGTGVDAANVPRVSLATNIALPAGANSIGQVTANAGTNLNTSALLTTAAHDAALGVAGTADAQVRSVQGIAGMTPVQSDVTQIGGAAFAQGQRTVANSVSFTPASNLPAAASCKTLTANAQGVAGATITVDATAGGITVMAASTTRCGAVVQNEQGGGDMRCATGALAPTTTVGFLVAAGQSVPVGLEGQEQMRCIRTGGVSATVSVFEETT